MSYDINRQQVDIENLFKQNVNDLASIKELYRKLKELEEKITQIKYIDSKLSDKLKKDYEKLKRIILDENIQIQLNNKIDDVINNTNEKINNIIEEIDEQLITKANKTDLDIERSRIDSFTRLSEGSTTGDAELIDGRIGLYGITYTNIGSAIRLQIKNILDTFNSIINGGYSPIMLEYTDGGYIDSTGDLVSYDNWKYTDYIDISNIENQSMIVNTTAPDSTLYNAFYNSEKVFIKVFNAKAGKINDVPISAKYVRMSCQSHYNQSLSILRKGINNTINNLETKVNNIGKETDIISLNKDLEPFIIQASEGLGRKFTNTSKPLVFTHFSDIHTRQELWDRIMEFNNYYSNYLNFSIHTGDYCGATQKNYINLYAGGNKCDIPVFNCVGNHDTYIDNNGTIGTKEKTKQLIFPKTDGWNVIFMDIANSMTYYKDFPTQKIRFIVLDYYFDIDAQCTWLAERLVGAKANNYHVVTCMHEMTKPIINKLDTTFQTIDNFESLGGNKYSISKFDKVIGDWIKQGGVHVANFAGHEHSDFIGYTENNVLNVCVQAATDDTIWTDGKREQGTKTWDCFNVVAVETSTGTLKLIRVGNNSDHYLREKKILSYDYINKRIITK